jgi:hypothetical protein
MNVLEPAAAPPLPRWRFTAAYMLALFCAGVLVVAAFFKAGDPALFAEQITGHHVTPASWSNWLAFFFIAAELLLGAALIAFLQPRAAFALTILMMLGFIGVTAWAWAHGDIRECGCFGRAIDRGPREVIIEDVVVIAAAALGIWLINGARSAAWRQKFFAALLLPVIILLAFGTSLPLDRLVVGVGPGSDLSRMVVEDLPVPLEEGRVLVAIVGPDCPACDEGVTQLVRIAEDQLVPHVVGAYAGKPGPALAWRLKHQPNFPVGNAPERVLRQYYRRLPATFLLEDGIVRDVWWGRIPLPDDVRGAVARLARS